jgi:hypothetical protein
MMAASVVSVPLATIDDSSHDGSFRERTDPNDDIDGVLPSEIDCRGRPLAVVAFTVRLRRHVSFDAVRSLVESLRRRPL